MCECALCRELFSGETTFAQHRTSGNVTGNPGSYFLGECQDPATRGLALNEHGVWSRAGSKEDGTFPGLTEVPACERVAA